MARVDKLGCSKRVDLGKKVAVYGCTPLGTWVRLDRQDFFENRARFTQLLAYTGDGFPYPPDAPEHRGNSDIRFLPIRTLEHDASQLKRFKNALVTAGVSKPDAKLFATAVAPGDLELFTKAALRLSAQTGPDSGASRAPLSWMALFDASGQDAVAGYATVDPELTGLTADLIAELRAAPFQGFELTVREAAQLAAAGFKGTLKDAAPFRMALDTAAGRPAAIRVIADVSRYLPQDLWRPASHLLAVWGFADVDERSYGKLQEAAATYQQLARRLNLPASNRQDAAIRDTVLASWSAAAARFDVTDGSRNPSQVRDLLRAGKPAVVRSAIAETYLQRMGPVARNGALTPQAVNLARFDAAIGVDAAIPFVDQGDLGGLMNIALLPEDLCLQLCAAKPGEVRRRAEQVAALSSTQLEDPQVVQGAVYGVHVSAEAAAAIRAGTLTYADVARSRTKSPAPYAAVLASSVGRDQVPGPFVHLGEPKGRLAGVSVTLQRGASGTVTERVAAKTVPFPAGATLVLSAPNVDVFAAAALAQIAATSSRESDSGASFEVAPEVARRATELAAQFLRPTTRDGKPGFGPLSDVEVLACHAEIHKKNPEQVVGAFRDFLRTGTVPAAAREEAEEIREIVKREQAAGKLLRRGPVTVYEGQRISGFLSAVTSFAPFTAVVSAASKQGGCTVHVHVWPGTADVDAVAQALSRATGDSWRAEGHRATCEKVTKPEVVSEAIVAALHGWPVKI